MKSVANFAAIVVVCLLLAGCKSEKMVPVDSGKHTSPTTAPSINLPKDTSITHFWFESENDNPPGKREWVKNADVWEEHYEDGHVTKFKIIKMVKEGQYERPQLQRIADDKFDDQLEVLLPPPVEGGWFEFRRPGESEWHQYKQIHLYPIRGKAPAGQ